MRKDKWIYIICGVMVVIVVMFQNNSHASVQANEGISKDAQSAVVMLKNNNGEPAGQVSLTQIKEGVLVNIQAKGLKPGIHGIHFHEKGVCQAPDFKTAGNHMNPYEKEHGLENPNGAHSGDMQNIFADSKGNVNTSIVNPNVTLIKGQKNSLLDEDGSSLVIHEDADDQKTNPSGQSGNRVICGVIK